MDYKSLNILNILNILNTVALPTGLTETVVAWQSKGLSNKKIRPPTSLNNSFSPKLK